MAERSPEHGTADGKPAVKYARLSDPLSGELIGERYWEPFHRDSLHRMYSITKSFTSLATGLLAAEGKIGLDDRICTYFPEKLPEGGAHPWCEEMTIRDLLTMRTCYESTTFKRYDGDWVESFFR